MAKREAKLLYFIIRRIIIFKTCQCYTESLRLNSKFSTNIIFAIFQNHISWEPNKSPQNSKHTLEECTLYNMSK